jgi:4-hydroxybenzoate polyprenyltransferase
MPLMLYAVLKLSRWREFVPFTLPLTLLGALMAYRFADTLPDARLGWVLLGNLLAVAYAFMLNDLEDAEDDKHDPQRAARNVISSGQLSRQVGWLVSFATAGLALAAYALAGRAALWVGGLTLLLGHLYSWKPIRLKALPILDVLSHVLMLSALLLLASYLIYDPAPRQVWLLVGGVTLFSAYGQLYNQLRDYEADQAAHLKNTAHFLGKTGTQWAAYASIGTGALCFLGAIIVGSFPLWLGLVLLASLPIARLFAHGQDMRGDTAADAVGDVQVQFLLMANLTLGAWLAFIWLTA